MLYLGIDQHKSQLTVSLRGEDGSVTLKRQVSTQWEKVRESGTYYWFRWFLRPFHRKPVLPDYRTP